MNSNTFHPQLSNTAVLKRVELAVINGGEIIFRVTKAKQVLKIVINPKESQGYPIFENQGVRFSLIDMAPNLFD